jgi:serine protease
MRRLHVLRCLMPALTLLAACQDGPTSPSPAAARQPSAQAAARGAEVPPRGETEGGAWAALPDDALWAKVERSGGVALVGLRAPGQVRGVYQGRVLATPAQAAEARHAVTDRPGVQLLDEHPRLPMVRVRIRDAATLAGIRRLGVVDYLEPAGMDKLGGSTEMSLGCSSDTWAQDGMNPSGYNPLNSDIISAWWGSDQMAVTNAWRRSSGRGVTVGIIDTGVDANGPELTTAFASGNSWGRGYQYFRWDGNTSTDAWNDQCAHGTKMANLAVGPNNASGTMGVAWAANLIAVRHDNNVLIDNIVTTSDYDAYQASRAIDVAAYNGAKVIGMAWGSTNSYAVISDVIDYWYYNGDRLFVGAAGTSPCDPTLDWAKSVVVFPASKPQVMAVTGTYSTGYPSCEAHHGSKVELAAVVHVPVSLHSGQISTFEGSSAATSEISGVAALVWSRWPYMSRDGVRAQLNSGGLGYPNRNSETGYGVINAHRALGGLWMANLGGCMKTSCDFNYKLLSCRTYTYSISYQGGDGPYAIRWDDNTTGTSTTRTLCPTAGRTVQYSISATVTDQSDGTALYRGVRMFVNSADPDGACPTCPK